MSVLVSDLRLAVETDVGSNLVATIFA